ncbi:unnamed protein product [Closterium sp. NIES-54]
MGVWDPARVCGEGHKRYFLLVVDDYSRYTTFFPLRSKGEVPEVLIDWIRGARRQLSESFGSDLPVLRLHSDRGGEFSSVLLRAFCRSQGIRQTFTLPASPQQNGIAERRIGMAMDVARTSMIHAAAPHFLWPSAVQYAAHQINLQPHVSLPKTEPTLRWTGKVGDASAFRVSGSRAFFYHPTSRLVLSSQDVTFDESVSYYRLFPYRVASLPPPPLFLVPGTPPVDPLPPQGLAPSGVSQVDPAEPVEVAVDSGAARGAAPAGAGTGGAEPGGTEPGGAEIGGADSGGAASWGAEPACAESGGSPGAAGAGAAVGAEAAGGAAGARATGGAAGARAAGGAAGAGATGGAAGAGAAGGAAGAGAAKGAAGTGAAGGAAGAGATGGAAGAGAAGGAAGAGAPGGTAGAGAAGAVGGGTGVVSAVCGGAARPRLQSPLPVQSQSPLPPSSPLPGPSPYSGPNRGLTERREPESRLVSPVSRARVPLPSPPASSLPDGPDSESDSLRAASPTFTRFLATAVTDPLFESTAVSALVAELVDFAAVCRLHDATSLVAESASVSVCPPSIGGECALGTDVLEDRQEEFECFAAAIPHLVSMLLALEEDLDAPDIPAPRSYAEAIEGPYSSQWQAAMDAEMASWKSTGTYVDEVPPPGVNIVSGMWIFRVMRPPGSPPVFKARYVARGFNDLLFATADTKALAHVKSELQKRHTSTDLGELTSYLGLRITRDRAQRTITLTQSHMVQQVLQRFGFTYSSPQSTPLPTGHSLSAPPSDESVEPSGPYPELVGCLMCTGMLRRGCCATCAVHRAWGSCLEDELELSSLVTLTPPGLTTATQRSSQGYTFSLGSGSVSWRSTRSSSVLSSSCEAEIYAVAMAAQELRWLTYLLTDLGEAPRSPPVLYVDNKAMLALCQEHRLEHRLEHRTKHIALRYFLARELQQRGQLRLAYVASQANTADVFTKALQPCDHQRFCTVLGLVPTVPHLLTS